MFHFRFAEIKVSMRSSPHRATLPRALYLVFTSYLSYKNNTHPLGWVLFLWRSRRDLNPRYPFGVHTISSRARYDHFDTAPWLRRSCRLAYDTICVRFCQVLFYIFLEHFKLKLEGGRQVVDNIVRVSGFRTLRSRCTLTASNKCPLDTCISMVRIAP